MESETALNIWVQDVNMFSTCEQCGCCSSACPITGTDGFNIRRIIRHIELGLIEEIGDTQFPWACTTCGRCEGVCPNGIAILDIIRQLRTKAPQKYIPNTAPCINACPGGIDIPGYLRLIAQGKPQEAYELILSKVPFPGILGRVCAHPCEEFCRRSEVNEPIAICSLKRYAADNSRNPDNFKFNLKPDTGHQIAVIGAGPSGLTAAFYLRLMGHHVTIFECRSKPGGMMRYGIPYYRLPEDVLEKEINLLLTTGIDLRVNKKLGNDVNLEQLKSDGYEAIYIAVGLQKSKTIELEGIELNDVFWGNDFLAEVNERKSKTLKDTILVVGGGNVAIDVALTSLRVGAKKVIMACLESREEMPAHPWEIETALEEGIQLMPSWGPKRIISENGRVKAVELVRCSSVFDQDGNFCPAFNETVETVAADQVILAIGQNADLSSMSEAGVIQIENNLISVNPETYETHQKGVFAGGDVIKGAGTIIEAVGIGKKVASSIDHFLGGQGVLPEATISEPGYQPESDFQKYNGKREKDFADKKRVKNSTIPISERYGEDVEIDICLKDQHAIEEANRCLQCDFEIKLACK